MSDWEEGRFWRVVADNGITQMETNDEHQARLAMEPGDCLERMWVRKQYKWVPAGESPKLPNAHDPDQA